MSLRSSMPRSRSAAYSPVSEVIDHGTLRSTRFQQSQPGRNRERDGTRRSRVLRPLPHRAAERGRSRVHAHGPAARAAGQEHQLSPGVRFDTAVRSGARSCASASRQSCGRMASASKRFCAAAAPTSCRTGRSAPRASVRSRSRAASSSRARATSSCTSTPAPMAPRTARASCVSSSTSTPSATASGARRAASTRSWPPPEL